MTRNDIIRVLLVDDEDRFLSTTSALLKRRGFEVNAVSSGIEALAEVKKGAADVVVLDVKMPEMDGNQALREIKKIQPELEVIMLTGHGAPDSALPGLRDGVFDYLNKPCDIDALSKKIRDAFAKERGVSEEPRVKDVMVPLSEFSLIHQDKPVSEAIKIVQKSFVKMTEKQVMKGIHRSILVMNDKDDIVGILTFSNLLLGLQPRTTRFLGTQSSKTDAPRISPLSYPGMFTLMTREMAQKTVGDLMSDAPPSINADANLMDAVNKFLFLKARRLLVEENGKPIGVLREQDLYFQMVKSLL